MDERRMKMLLWKCWEVFPTFRNLDHSLNMLLSGVEVLYMDGPFFTDDDVLVVWNGIVDKWEPYIKCYGEISMEDREISMEDREACLWNERGREDLECLA